MAAKNSSSRAGRATKSSSKEETKNKTTKATSKNTKKNSGPENKKNTRSTSAKKVSTPTKKKTESKGRGGANREMDEVTGFAVGTESHQIAELLLNGVESRQEAIDILRNTLDTETRNGTEKPVANLVSGVINKLLARGFTVESSYRLVEPTPASIRAANKRAKELEDAPKRGRGRPPRNPAPAKKKTARKK